jgi:hypothetical protein
MSGLRLAEMDSAEMLDVVHVIFEEDYTNATSGEQVDAKNKIRKIIYKEFYEKNYEYNSSSKTDYSDLEPEESGYDYSDVVPFDPAKAETKPFVPSTDFDADAALPFGKTLDAPLG